MKNFDSSGFDEILISAIKSTIEYIAEPLTSIINFAIYSEIFCDKMKIAQIFPYKKTGDKWEFTNYRPISILTNFSKILEKIIVVRLNSFIDKPAIFSYSQFDLRKDILRIWY